jgi:hypothetical protein
MDQDFLWQGCGDFTERHGLTTRHLAADGWRTVRHDDQSAGVNVTGGLIGCFRFPTS